MARIRWHRGGDVFSQLERMSQEMDRLLTAYRPGAGSEVLRDALLRVPATPELTAAE